MNTATHSNPSDVQVSCKTLVDTLRGLGTSWAAYGLKVGKMALQTSAETLGKTAETLDTLAAAFEKKAEEGKSDSTPAPEGAVKDEPSAAAPVDAPPAA